MLIAETRVFIQQLLDDIIQSWSNVGIQLQGWYRCSIEDLVEDRGRRGTDERRLARQGFVNHGAQRKQVGPRVERFAQRLLGRHVRQRAQGGSIAGELPDVARNRLGAGSVETMGLGEPEIQNLRLSAIRDEDVRWLDIPMDDSRRMSGIQGIGQLRAQFQDFVAFEAPLTRQSCLECLSPEQFHHDEGLALVIAHFVNRTDVGMIQSGGGTGLTLESRNTDRILADRVWKNLNRNLASQLLILRPIHLSHPAFSEGRQDFIVSQRCARREHG